MRRSRTSLTRQGSTFAYHAEVDGDVVQFPWVIFDDEMVCLICVGRGPAEVVQAAMGCPGADVDLNKCHNFFLERIALPQTGWLVWPCQ